MSEAATACERCRLLGTTAFHNPTLGGDDPADALLDQNDNEEGGSGGFVRVGRKWPQPGGLGTPVTITYSYQNMFEYQNLPGQGLMMPNGQRLPDSLIWSSIEEALGRWASVAPLNFVEVPDDGRSYAQASTQYGQIRFRHVYINGPDPPSPQPPIAKAQAYYPSTSIFAGDVEYDHGDPWQEVGTLPVPDILGATVHELGHSLGLGHTSISQANMYWIFTRYSGLGTSALHSDDIAGIRSIYGAGVGSVTPLPRAVVPEPASWLLIFIATLAFANRRRRAAHDRLPSSHAHVALPASANGNRCRYSSTNFATGTSPNNDWTSIDFAGRGFIGRSPRIIQTIVQFCVRRETLGGHARHQATRRRK